MKKLGIGVGVLLVLAAAAFAYVWFSGGSGAPSAPVTAPPVTAPPVTAQAAAPAEEGVETTAAVTSPSEAETSETPAPDVSEAGAEEGIAEQDVDEGGAVVYRIDKAGSSVRFEIDELLNGNPKRVVGVTSEVAGEVLVDFADPSASRIGAIVINVRTLETDSGFRDRAMRGPILGSARDENEFAVFEPASVEGFPDQAAVGDRIPLTVAGDLTLSGATRPVVFVIEVTLVSEDLIEVSGSATVLRSDFGLFVPDVPSVSDVADEVTLAVDLTAAAVRP